MVTSSEAVEETFRRERGRVIAALRRYTTCLEEAEDFVSIAFEKALVHWSAGGVPERPGAWLLTVARNEALGALRHQKVVEAKYQEPSLAREDYASTPSFSDYPDERLSLLFCCCHPALDESARIALTLSTLSGLSTREIAKAFVTAESTLAQRLVRAKRKIRAAGVPYEVPGRAQLPERLTGVLRVIYLIFTEGYRASYGTTRIRHDLCEDALLLARALCDFFPEEAEVLGLEALLWLHHARREARQDALGSIVFLEDQDRTTFVLREIELGEGLLHRALALGEIGPYQLQAAIAAQHCLAPSFQETPWETIIQLYERLHSLEPSPIIALNRAAAIGLGRGADAGLEELARAGLARSLGEYGPYHAARGELHARNGGAVAAQLAFEKALSLASNGPEIVLLRSRLKKIEIMIAAAVEIDEPDTSGM